MRSRYKVVQEGIYFITSTVTGWIKIFNEDSYCKIIIDELKYRKNKKQMDLYGYVIMPNHIHLIITANRLSNLMRSFKSHTARKIINDLIKEKNDDVLNKIKLLKKKSKAQSEYQLWQEGFHPKLVVSEKELRQKLDYIHLNPVRSGIIDEPQEWKYSSYNNYYGGNIIIEMDSLYN